MDELSTNSKSKIGRKGDPRMHGAVLARLNDPQISLYQALLIGGFDFPTIDENDSSSTYSLVDSEGALLGQRKNQLSRRLREAKREIELRNKREENATLTTASVETPCAATPLVSESLKRSSQRSSAACDDGSLSVSSMSATNVVSMSQINYQNSMLASAAQTPHKKPKALVSSAQSYDTEFSEKHKYSDAFSIPTITCSFDAESIYSYCKNPKQDMKCAHKHKRKYDSQNSTLAMSLKTKSCELKTDLTDGHDESNDTTSIAAEKKTYVSNIHQRLYENELEKPEDLNENSSVATNRSQNSKQVRNNPMFKKAIDLFNSGIHTYLQGVMKKAGYSPGEVTEHNIEYGTFFAEAINSEIEIFEQFKSNHAFSSSNSIPLKKRRPENSSNISFPRVSLEDIQHTTNAESVDTKSIIYLSKTTAIYRQNLFSKEVAVKVLTKVDPCEEEFDLIQNEYNIAKSINHPNIREAIQMKYVDSKPAVVLKWIDGKTIAEHGKCRNIEEFLSVSKGIVGGLAALHEARIVHRQININNILVQQDKRIKIIGMGRSIRFIDTHFSSIGHFEKEALDLRFISPEQTGKVNREIDFRTDFYSLGIVFYYMLSGKCPFEADSNSEIIRLHISGRPSTMCASIPDAILKLVSRLMKKMPEDRFSSAKNLLHDLELMASQLPSDNRLHSIESFTNEPPDCILLPQRLFGRDIECKILSTALEKSCLGSLEVTLITGPTGCGKSKLASSTSEFVTIKGGYFITGEFDHPHRGCPYSAIQHALASFCDQILMESHACLMNFRNIIVNEVGRDIELLFNIVPKLRLVTGDLSGKDDIFYGESLSLLYAVLIKFMKCACSEKHPIVLHIDAMQYADKETLDLIEVLIKDTSIKYLLFIGSYSDDDIDNNHPIIKFVKNIKGKLSYRHHMEIGDLSKENISELISNAFFLAPMDAHPLTSLIMKKTKGNAIFAILYISFLCKENFICYCNDSKKWTWNEEAIIEKSDSVMGLRDVLLQNLNRLDVRGKMTLIVASLIKAPFTKSAIYRICNDHKAVVQKIDEGLLIPCNLNPNMYKLVHSELKYIELSLLSESQRKILQYKIGKTLLRECKEHGENSSIFDLNYYINSSVDFFIDRREHLEAAKLNLRAGQKAKSVSAYSMAAEYYKVGIKCMAHFDHTEQDKLRLKLYNGAIEASCHMGDKKMMDEFAYKLSKVPFTLDMVNSVSAQINFLFCNCNYVDSYLVGKKFLDSICVYLPSKSQKEILSSMIYTEYIKTKSMYEDKSDHIFLNMETIVENHHHQQIATLIILQDIISPCQMVYPELVPYIVVKQVQLTLRYGVSKYVAQIFSMYGAVLCSEFDEFEDGYRFSQLAESFLNAKSDFRPILHIKVNETILTRVTHWMSHIHVSLENLLKLSETARNSFMSEMSKSVRATYLCYYVWNGGSPLFETTLFTKSINFEDDASAAIYQAYENITGKNKVDNPGILNYESYNFDAKLSLFSSFSILFNAMFLAFLFRDYERAATIIDEYRPLLTSIKGTFQYALHYFYDGLIATFMLQMGEKNSKWMVLALDSLENLRKWNTQCPANFSSKYSLLEAEMANVKNNDSKTREMFERASSLAINNKMLFEEALISERAGIFYLKSGFQEKSIVMLSNACELYEAWGSSPKVEQIHNLHPEVSLITADKSESVLVLDRTSRASIISDLTFDNISRGV